MRNFTFERNIRNIKFPCNLLQMLPMGHIQRLQAYYYYFVLRLLNHVIPRLKTLVKDDEENVYRLHKIIRALIFNPTGTPRRIHVDTSKTKFWRISAYFLNVISMVQKFTSFPCNFFDVISLVGNSTLFPRTFCDVIWMAEKSTLSPRTFLNMPSIFTIHISQTTWGILL